FDKAVRTVNGSADLQVRAVTPAGFDETLYPKLARAPGIAVASPVVELQAARLGRPDAGFTLSGLDSLRAGAVTPDLLGGADMTGAAGSPAGVSRIVLSQAALEAAGVRVGQTVEVTAGGASAPLLVAGVLPQVSGDQRLGVLDIADAQWRFGRLGRLDRIDLRLKAGADAGAAERAVAALLPRSAELGTRESEARRSDALSRAYRVNLDMLALV